MERAAIPRGLTDRRMTWLIAEVRERRDETPTAVTLVLDVRGWPGHAAGSHLDVRLTAEDGYSTQRSYSIASAAHGSRVELTVQRVPGGEVSPYLVDVLEPGDLLEVRGPVGGWFVWCPEQTEPIVLVAGGSGLVPLMSMIRSRRDLGSRAPFRLICSARTPDDLLYAAELKREAPGLDVTYLYTRSAPPQSRRPAGRLTGDDLARHGWPPDSVPTCYVCGPTGFVEKVAALLVALGHHPGRIRTERFG